MRFRCRPGWAPLLAVALAMGASSCVAVSRTAPLNARTAEGPPLFGTVHVTSGTFSRPHQVVGVFQTTQEGYRWMHELEVVSDADPNSILYKVSLLALQAGAQGIQRLELVDENPQSIEERRMKQVQTAVRFVEQMQRGQPPGALGEGTETRYHAKGELVRFTEGTPTP